ncbi:MAG: BlaI/MecI/CopY family transcriptional regulator [Alloprevotella sp.]|nr:BlaI/MecI/CopY family transcriptional regulator [Alloprevotella sp.]MBR1653122.1 BlaI/MecI/CopY family transcriptional regulator [Alloprevotella sp.]
MEHLTYQEEAAMRRIWEGAATVKDIHRLMGEEMPYTTLASVVKNLERKGFVRGERVGMALHYAPLVTAEEYKRSSLGAMVRHYFAGSYRQVVNFFVEEQKLSKEDLEEMIRMIEDGKTL